MQFLHIHDFQLFLCDLFHVLLGEDPVHDRDHDQRSQSRIEQTADANDGYRLHHFRTGAQTDSQRQKSQDRRNSRHQNRTHTDSTCLDDSALHIHAFQPEPVDTVYQYDSIIDHDTHQHNESHHGYYADVLTADQQCQHPARKCQRNRKYHDKRRAQ